jgi:hypothetical protein
MSKNSHLDYSCVFSSAQMILLECHESPAMDFPSWLVHNSNHRIADCNFNPPAISRWTRKCPGNVADSSCELPDFSWKKYSNIGRCPGNGNRYPPGHEHGYQACIEGCKVVPPNFQLKNSKDPPFDAHQQIQWRSTKFLRRPHFVGDFLCMRSCFNLQLSSESSCKAPSFYVWKTSGRFSDNFCDCFEFRVCSGFRIMFRGGGSKFLWKTELDWVLGFCLGFRRKAYTC